VIDLVTTMSKFLLLWMPLEAVVASVTTTPARALAFPEKIGSLAEGNVGNATILTIEQGEFEFIDTRRQSRVGRERIRAVAAVQRGVMTRV
jgi:dihydroorotase